MITGSITVKESKGEKEITGTIRSIHGFLIINLNQHVYKYMLVEKEVLTVLTNEENRLKAELHKIKFRKRMVINNLKGKEK